MFIGEYQWKVVSFNSLTTDKSTTKCTLLFQGLNAKFFADIKTTRKLEKMIRTVITLWQP